MNLSEIKNQVIEAFFKNPYFGVGDFKRIKLPEALESVRESVIRNCLDDLVAIKFVRPLLANGSEPKTPPAPASMWIMEEAIGAQGQEVSVSLRTASLVANVINRYREANNIEDGMCNVLAIDEGDIVNLCQITLQILTEKTKDAEES